MSAPLLTSRRLVWLTIGFVLAVLLWWHAAIVAPFLLSLVLAYVLQPAVLRLQRWRVPRALAIGLCLLAVLLLAATVFVLLVPIVSKLTPMLREQLPDLLVGVWGRVVPWLSQFGLSVPATADELKDWLVAFMQDHVSQWGGAIWKSVLAGGGGLMSVFGMALLVPMLAFYWLLDWERLGRQWSRLVPPRWRAPGRAVMAECDELFGQYLRGQLLVMGVLAVYYSVGLSAFGFSLALPIGVFTGLAVCIPYLGFGLGMILALLAGLLQFGAGEQGVWWPLVAVAVVYGLGQVVESFFLTPRLVGERIGLHPLGVIFALMLFGKWMGFWGLLIALPVSALMMVLGRRALLAWQASRLYQAD